MSSVSGNEYPADAVLVHHPDTRPAKSVLRYVSKVLQARVHLPVVRDIDDVSKTKVTPLGERAQSIVETLTAGHDLVGVDVACNREEEPSGLRLGVAYEHTEKREC